MRCTKARRANDYNRRGGEHALQRTGGTGLNRWRNHDWTMHEWICSCGMTGWSSKAGNLPLSPTAVARQTAKG